MAESRAPQNAMRVECPHAQRCAGCPQIAHAYDAQLVFKRERVGRALARYTWSAPDGMPIVGVRPAENVEHYRTRTKLVVAPGPRIGLFDTAGQHDVVDIPDCRVMSLACREVVATIRALCDAASRDPSVRTHERLWRPFDPRAHQGTLRALDVRETRDEADRPRVLVTLIVDAGSHATQDEWRACAEALATRTPAVECVAISTHAGRSPRMLGETPACVWGSSRVRDVVDARGTWQFASPGAFVQAHREQARAIGSRVGEVARALITPGHPSRVLELYAGAGALGLPLARDGASVTMVESFAPAAAAAESAAREQKLDVEVLAADAVAVVRQWARDGRAVDMVVVNPPRRGLAPDVRTAIGELRPARVAYVSCEPESLSRDLAHLQRLGMRAARIETFDMIPLTDEVESLAILERSEPEPPRERWSDDEVGCFDADPFESTTPQGEHRGSLLDRVRALPGYARAVPIHRLDIGTSGLCLFARSPDSVSEWSAALAAPDARKTYVALCKGVLRAKGTLRVPLKDDGVAREAVTRYARGELVAGHTLARVSIEHGRTHQIRRHLASIGHPVIGDERYGHAPTNRHAEERWLLDRTFLHASRLTLTHPRTRAPLTIESPLPGDLHAVLERMRAQPSSTRVGA